MNACNLVSNSATVSTSMARMVLRAAQEAGLDANHLRDAARIESAALEDPDGRIPYADYMSFWTLAGDAHPGFGLFVAERFVDATSLGILGLTAAHCQTFSESVERAVQFIQLVNENTLIRFERGSASGIVTDIPRDPNEQWPAAHAEMALGAFAMLGKKWTGRSDFPLFTNFQHAKPAYHEAYRRIFGDSVRFGQALNQIVLPKALLDAPVAGANPELTRLLDRQATGLLRNLDKEPLVPRLHRWAADVLPKHGTPQLDRAARELGMSTRTLQRRLMEAGTRFDQIVDAERRRIALAALVEANTTVMAAAARAGYTDASAFRDAVRRWTGCAPSEFRKKTAPGGDGD